MSLGPLMNARDIKLNQNPGTLPNVSESILSWFQLVTFIKIEKRVVDFNLAEFETSLSFFGVVQPTQQNLRMLPEGQRNWLYQTVHALPNLILTTDDTVIYDCVRYRVTGKTDWSRYGYVEYSLTQDFRKGSI
jgi:hypothetical protein